MARNSGVTEEPLICLGGDMWCLFPWLGSYAFLAMERFLKCRCAGALKLTGLAPSRPYFIQFKMQADKRTFSACCWNRNASRWIRWNWSTPTKYLSLKVRRVPAGRTGEKGVCLRVLGIDEMRERIRGWEMFA
ncbi:MAG: hypothetical protein ACLSFT_01915 [Ruminococcus callidus]